MAELTPVPMADRNGKVTTRHVRPTKTSSRSKQLPAPTVVEPVVYDYELDDVYWGLKHKNAGIHGATVTVDGFFKARNLEALNALRDLNLSASETTEIGSVIAALQGKGKSLQEVLTPDFYRAHKEVKWSLIRASRAAKVGFPGGYDPPRWAEVAEILYEDISREKTLHHLIWTQGILDPIELRSEVLRFEEHPQALTDGIL